jgi:hypothetical protein
VGAADSLYTGCRFPEEIISHAVWLYYRCSATISPNSPHSATGSPSNPQPDTKTTLAQRNPAAPGAGACRSPWVFLVSTRVRISSIHVRFLRATAWL